MAYALPSYLIQKMLHSRITPGEQRWHPHHQITIAFCFPQLISHSFLGLSAGKFEKKQRCTKQEKKNNHLSFFSWAGVRWGCLRAWKAELQLSAVSWLCHWEQGQDCSELFLGHIWCRTGKYPSQATVAQYSDITQSCVQVITTTEAKLKKHKKNYLRRRKISDSCLRSAA